MCAIRTTYSSVAAFSPFAHKPLVFLFREEGGLAELSNVCAQMAFLNMFKSSFPCLAWSKMFAHLDNIFHLFSSFLKLRSYRSITPAGHLFVAPDHNMRMTDFFRCCELVELKDFMLSMCSHDAQSTDGDHLVDRAGPACEASTDETYLAHPEHSTSAAASTSKSIGIVQ